MLDIDRLVKMSAAAAFTNKVHDTPVETITSQVSVPAAHLSRNVKPDSQSMSGNAAAPLVAKKKILAATSGTDCNPTAKKQTSL